VGGAPAPDTFEISTDCSARPKPTILALPIGTGSLRLVAKGDADVLIKVSEAGQQVIVSPASVDLPRIPIPLRFGQYWVLLGPTHSVELKRFQANGAPGPVQLEVHCPGAEEDAAQLNWLTRASALASSIKMPVPAEEFDPLVRALESLQDAAIDAPAGALAAHMLAQAYLVNERNSDAAAAFETAEICWERIGDSSRALVARVARVEDLRRIGSYEKALALTRNLPKPWLKESYFSVRLENTRCLVLNTTGLFEEAERCYDETLRRLEALDESAELVDTMYDYSLLLMNRGLAQKAQVIADKALVAASDIDIPYVQGHLRYLMGWLAFRRGDLSRSLFFANAALAYFDEAHMPRWKANVLLDVTALYASVGADEEAYASLDQALKYLSIKDAPARVAAAMMIFASLERSNQRLTSAHLWYEAAEAMFSRLNMPIEHDSALLSKLDLEVQQGHSQGVEQTILEHLAERSLNDRGWTLLAAHLALAERHADGVRVGLSRLKQTDLSLPEQMDVVRLEADLEQSLGNPSGAQGTLLTGVARLYNVARQTKSPLLRYMIARQDQTLRRSALAKLMQPPTGQSVVATSIDKFWPWVSLTHLDQMAQDEQTYLPKDTGQFDRAVAAELLNPSWQPRARVEPRAPTELLIRLAVSGRQDAPPSNVLKDIPLAAVRQRLAPDAAFVAYLDGNSHGALLWVTRESVAVMYTDSPDAVRASVTALRELLRSPSSSSVEIHAAAQRLSSQLFTATPRAHAPRHLYVLAEEPLNGVPWAVLSWPGATSPLVDTTSIKLVRLDSALSDDANYLPESLHVIVAAQQGEHPVLPPLAGAIAETAVIGSAISSASVPLQSLPATRVSFLSALQELGGWIHIAAHGASQPQHIGYAGIWLEPPKDEKIPPFLSWIDILDSGVNADLVVLNACQLGDSGSAINGNLSFADAVSRAGAKHVVAALWPVSDAASALWVPEFYATIVADAHHDAAEALRAAQLRLRESRAFRHPFFWAGMQVIDRMPVGPRATH